MFVPAYQVVGVRPRDKPPDSFRCGQTPLLACRGEVTRPLPPPPRTGRPTSRQSLGIPVWFRLLYLNAFPQFLQGRAHNRLQKTICGVLLRGYPGGSRCFCDLLRILKRRVMDFFIGAQATEHELNRTDLHLHLAGPRVIFVVLTQAAATSHPGEGPLHYPAPVQQHEPFGPGRPRHHLDGVARLLPCQPAVQLPVVVFAVRPQQAQPRELRRGEALRNTRGACVPSSRAADVTATASSNPIVSTTMWRLRPLTFLPPS